MIPQAYPLIKIACYIASDILTFTFTMRVCIISLTQESPEHPVTAKLSADLLENVGLG